MSSWKKRLVNLHQEAEERRAKYQVLKDYGLTPGWARNLRDWPIAKIDRFLASNGYTAEGSPE